MTKLDPIKVVNTIYFEESRSVPYPVFMQCFDRLLENPPELDPAEPSKELEPCFRAVCLALDRGVADTEGRDKDREKEFYNHICPVWKEQMGNADFRPFQQILDRKVRQRMEGKDRENISSREKRSEEPQISPEQRHATFEKAMEDALEASMQIEEQQQKDVSEKASSSRDSEQEGAEEAKSKKSKIPVLKNIRALTAAFKKEIVKVRFADINEKLPCARYYMGSAKITVQLIRTERSYYCVLNYPQGIEDRADVENQILAVTSNMGYTEHGRYIFVKKKGQGILKIKIGQKSTYIACKRESEFDVDFLVDILPVMHSQLDNLIDELELK